MRRGADTIDLMSEFQIFAKPVGARCNLRCSYCYFLPHQEGRVCSIPDELLEAYIIQHIEACTDSTVQFSWHGGEPALFGLEGFRRIVALQKKHCPEGRHILNGIQTNGLLLNDRWCEFLAEERFFVGISIDGMEQVHDLHRVTADGHATHARAVESYERLLRHGVATECLCVVHSETVCHPMAVYEFFRGLEVPYLSFIPLVEPLPDGGVTTRSVPSDAWGEFLCTVFDAWLESGIGNIKIQIFEEAARSAFGLDHSLCIFRRDCNVPALQWNGDLYSCDHYMTPGYHLGNIRETPLAALIDSPRQQAFSRAKQESLTSQCRECAVVDMCNGGCPKDRIIKTIDDKPGLNYLCSGYRRFFTHCRPFVEAVAQLWLKSCL